MSCFASNASSPVLLGTVQLYIEDIHGVLHQICALYDTGSHISAITKSCTRYLGLKEYSLVGTSFRTGSIQYKKSWFVILPSPFAHFFRCSKRQSNIVSEISHSLPATPLSDNLKEKFSHIVLADDHFNVPSKVDFLIGADMMSQILISDDVFLIPGSPTAINTIFRWILIGPVDQSSSFSSVVSLHIFAPDINQTLNKFWESEEIPQVIPIDPLDAIAEEHFLRTRTRDNTGRYIVSLPFNPETTPVYCNASKSLLSFLRLEKKLSRCSDKYPSYQAFLQEYLELCHMSLASATSSYVIPHHIASKEDSSTTKVRVVFNASDPDTSGVSLNERLLKRPKLQLAIENIAASFRLHRIALCTDIKQMYRQILLSAKDRCYQHIYWRPNCHSEIQEYELNPLPMG